MTVILRRDFLSIAAALPLTVVGPRSNFASEPVLKGVNISGGEFGKKGGNLGKAYFYPDFKDIEKYASLGFQAIRVPFKWERLQFELFGELRNRRGGEDDINALAECVREATDRGLVCILDMHNYGRRMVGEKPSLIGEEHLPIDAFVDCWIKLAKLLGSQIWLGLMNEPHGIPAATWAAVIQKTVYQIRESGIPNKMLVPGTAWTGAHSWVSSGNASAFDEFRDPLDNCVFEVHQYFDKDFSGTKEKCVSGSGFRPLQAFENWCRQRPGRKGFLGEFGIPRNDSECALLLEQLLSHMEANQDVWIGWTAWGGGRWWGRDYPLRIESTSEENRNTKYLDVILK